MVKLDEWVDGDGRHTTERLESRYGYYLFWDDAGGAWISKPDGTELPEHGFYKSLKTARQVFSRLAGPR